MHDEEILTWSISLHTTQIKTDKTREADLRSFFHPHSHLSLNLHQVI